VRLVDRDDVVGELVAQQVDLRLGDQVVAREVVRTRCELVIGVLVERRVEAGHALGATDSAFRHVDVDGRTGAVMP
jgi:hypothetical protein